MEDEIRDILKLGDVSIADMLIKVYDTNTGKEGWLDVEQILNNIASAVEETDSQQIKEMMDSVSPSPSLESRSTAEEDNNVKQMTASVDNQSADTLRGCGNAVKMGGEDNWLCGYEGYLCPECRDKIQSQQIQPFGRSEARDESEDKTADVYNQEKLGDGFADCQRGADVNSSIPDTGEEGCSVNSSTDAKETTVADIGSLNTPPSPVALDGESEDICPIHNCEMKLSFPWCGTRYCPSCEEELNIKQDIEEDKCFMSVDGKCTSDYSPLKCNGSDIPKDCTYTLQLKETAEILADKDCMESIRKSLQQFMEGKGIPLSELYKDDKLGTFNPCKCEVGADCSYCVGGVESNARHPMIDDVNPMADTFNKGTTNKVKRCPKCNEKTDWLSGRCFQCEGNTPNAEKKSEDKE